MPLEPGTMTGAMLHHHTCLAVWVPGAESTSRLGPLRSSAPQPTVPKSAGLCPSPRTLSSVSSLTSPGHARLPLPAPVNMCLVLCCSSLHLAAACDCGECPGSPSSPRNDSDRTGLFDLIHACLLQVPPVAGVLPAGLCPFCPAKAAGVVNGSISRCGEGQKEQNKQSEWNKWGLYSNLAPSDSGHCGDTLPTIELSLCRARNPSAMGLPWSCHWPPLAP